MSCRFKKKKWPDPYLLRSSTVFVTDLTDEMGSEKMGSENNYFRYYGNCSLTNKTGLFTLSIEFLITSLIVVLIPGTGVLFTISTGLTRGWRASIFAAVGCTVGIIPHLMASVFGLAAILHTSALAFHMLKILGVLYLAYLAWEMWRDSGKIQIDNRFNKAKYRNIAVRAFLINILNPKLSIFFLAFLPQFVPQSTDSPIPYMLLLSAVFMLMTLIVFIGYGVLANQVRHLVLHSPKILQAVQRVFSALFVTIAIKLATMER